ncbi:LacI family DNA-binding transcriptional regulator [Anaerovorax sp. IOR16]|uniref:LacI family DNA-binding transcriptional regulator n=1 Tax=Anaerovorax sp. IOR16 TaxID=2773458 RepID=UPI002ED51D5F
MKRQVTMKDIAKEAGVSIATVSMICNNKDKNISEATRTRILELIAKRGYVPNVMARSLVTKKTKTIGLIIPDITNPFFPEIARGAEDMASKSGYSVIYCNTDDKIKRQDNYIKILTEKMVDGIIFAHSAEKAEADFNKFRIPIVLIDRDSKADNVVGRVLVDNEAASMAGVSYLIQQGYKKIAYIAGSMKTKTAQDRLAGYRRALMEHGMPYDLKWVKKGSYRSQWGYDAIQEFEKESLSFDAIFCGNDLIAIGAIKALKEKGIYVPKDVGILGFDDVYLAQMTTPPLTTIRQPKYEMGYRAAELLIDVIEKEKKQEEKKERIILDTELVIRQSTK